MKKHNRILVVALMLVVAMGMLAGCGSKKEETKKASSDKKTIKLAVRADGVDHANYMVEPMKEMGYKLEIVPFDDSIQPNVALSEGSVDANLFQHRPYLQAYNEQNGTDLVMVKPYLYYPLFAMYSTKYDKIKDLPDGATIGLCNDASNQARGLNLLASQKLITLKKGVETPTIHDIAKNPHNFNFVEAEMTTMANAINDYDAICLAAAHIANAVAAGNTELDPSKYLAQSDDAEEYALGIVVNPKDKDEQWVQDLIKSCQNDNVAKYFKEKKMGTLVPLWDTDIK